MIRRTRQKKTKEQRPVVEIKSLRVKYDKVVLKKIDWKINRESNGSFLDQMVLERRRY